MQDVQFYEDKSIDMVARRGVFQSKAGHLSLSEVVGRRRYHMLILYVVFCCFLMSILIYMLILNSRLHKGTLESQHYMQVDQRLYRSDRFQTQ